MPVVNSPGLNELLWAVIQRSGTLWRVKSQSGGIGLQSFNFWIDRWTAQLDAKAVIVELQKRQLQIADASSLTRILEGE